MPTLTFLSMMLSIKAINNYQYNFQHNKKQIRFLCDITFLIFLMYAICDLLESDI